MLPHKIYRHRKPNDFSTIRLLYSDHRLQIQSIQGKLERSKQKMLFAKHKKTVIALAAVVAMSLGGAAASAATVTPSLNPAGPLDLSKVQIQAGTYSVVKGVTPHLADGQTAKTEANLTMTAVPGKFDPADVKDVKEGTFTVVKGVVPQALPMQGYTTSPRK
jgi:hypothetical protein